MKKQILLISFLTLPTILIAEMALPEFASFEHTIDPEKFEQTRIEQALKERAENNYKNALLLKDSRREKYVKNAQNLSSDTQRLLVTPQDHEFSTKADIDRLNQEIAREKNKSSKLWFNSDKSGSLIKDLENLKMNLQKKQIDKILQERKLKTSQTANLDEPNLSPSKKSEPEDIGSQVENNPLSPKQNFDYDAWKNKLLEKKALIEDEQKQINKKITLLKKQEAYQKNLLLGIKDQQNEIFKDFSKKTLSPERIDYISTELVHSQAEVKKLEDERSESVMFKTFGNHEHNEKIQELKQQIKVWKDETEAYDRLQELAEREKIITEKIQNLQHEQDQHNLDLKTLDEQAYETNSSMNNADFHLKRIDTYLNSL